MRTRSTCALIALSALIPASAAEAASPPKGDYSCTSTTLAGTFYGGTLNIVSKKTYSVNDKKKGKYRTRGKKIKFKTGDYRTLYFGRWRKVKNVLTSGYRYQIKLYGKKDRKEKLVCDRSSG